jgi:hypothetical protein
MSRDTDEDPLYDAAHDAFMRFWREADTEEADALWLAYCAAQERLEQWLSERERPDGIRASPAAARVV